VSRAVAPDADLALEPCLRPAAGSPILYKQELALSLSPHGTEFSNRMTYLASDLSVVMLEFKIP
jgi:hypothetical protein